MSECDLLLKNAKIIDGTGAPAFKGAVAVKGERIFIVERVEGEPKVDATEVIDTRELVVAPGFVDVHSHGDLSILYYPKAESFVYQGITSFVGGNCGMSPGPYGDYLDLEDRVINDLWWKMAPDMYYEEPLLPREAVNEIHKEWYGWEIDWSTLGEWMERVLKMGISCNVVPIVGHGEVRYLVMGQDYRRVANRKEVSSMCEYISEAMEDGCRGLSVGRDLNPGYHADLSELIACAEISAKYGGVYSSHSLRTGLREYKHPSDPPSAKINGILEDIDVSRKARLPVEISHLSPLFDVWPQGNPIMTEAAVKATLKVVDDARSEGIDVNFDLIPNSTGGIFTRPYLVSILLPWLKVAGSVEQLGNALAMPALREEIKATILSGKWYRLNPSLKPQWASAFTIAECKEKKYKGKTITQVAEKLKKDSIDALMDIIRTDPYTKATRMGSDASFLMLVKHPAAMIGIDTYTLDNKWEIKTPPGILPNENTYGGFPRYLRRAVRETNTLTLVEAVKKVTSLPASKFKLRDRGVLKEGAYADIVVFDPEVITDRGDALRPRVYPKGIEYVMVNGKLVVRKTKHTGATPGKVLRRE